MAFKLADRVRAGTTTTGTGTYTLGAADTGFRTFESALGAGDTTAYCCTDGTSWEVGIGTFSGAGPYTLARTSILASSNAGAAVNWAAGTKSIFVTNPAKLALTNGGQTIALADANYTLTLAQFFNGDIEFTGTLTAGRTITIPFFAGRNISIKNSTTQILTITNGGVSTITIAVGDVMQIQQTPSGVSGLGFALMTTLRDSKFIRGNCALQWISGLTSLTFTGIPTDARRVRVVLADIQPPNNQYPYIQVKNGGTIKTSGYIGVKGRFVDASSAANYSSDTGMLPYMNSPNQGYIDGYLEMQRTSMGSGYEWIVQGLFNVADHNSFFHVSGSVSISTLFDAIVLTASGGGTFVYGNATVFWERE